MLLILSVLSFFLVVVDARAGERADDLIVEALKEMEKEQFDAARVKIAQSKDPVASHIFNWMYFQKASDKEWDDARLLRLMRFIRKNEHWPSLSYLKKRVERLMPEEFSNAEVIAWYDDYPPKTVRGMGLYLDALLINGRQSKVRRSLSDWWASSASLKEGQRKMLRKYGAYLSKKAHRTRLNMLLDGGHYKSALALADVLGDGYPALVRARQALATQGQNVDGLVRAVPSHLSRDAGLLYERLRWRRKKDLNEGALDILVHEMPRASKLSQPKAWWRERHIMIRRLLEEKRYDDAYMLARMHVQKEGFAYAQAQWLTGWLALRFMDKPSQAYARFTALHGAVKTPVSKARAAYWAGLAVQDLGQERLAVRWYKKAAQFQTVYYGQMAAAALSAEGEMAVPSVPVLTHVERRSYRAHPFMRAYGLFYDAGLMRRADAFLWAFLRQDDSAKAYVFAAEYAGELGDRYRAVRVSKKAVRQGMFMMDHSYPRLGKNDKVHGGADPALVHALIRQESMFDQKARSPVGALGLMQLMPPTAREVAGKLKVPYRKAWLTERSAYNVKLGSSYIGTLLKRYDGNYFLAVAAYNAGAGRVDRWLKTYGDPRVGDLSPIDWVELIPIYETRNYVQRVMEGVYTYRLLMYHSYESRERDLHIAFHVKR